MAPLHIEDGFIMTISDGDSISGEEEDDEEVLPEDVTEKPDLKRKRGQNEDDSRNKKRNKKNKPDKQLESSNHKTGKRSANGEDQENEMDSDFEFLVDDGNLRELEEFDGWGSTNKEDSDKKAVDIDALIAKKRQKKGLDLDSTEDSNIWDGINSDEDEDLDDDDDDDNEEESPEDEDELLAPDGFGMGAGLEDEDEDVADETDDESASDNDSIATPVPHPMDNELVEVEEEDEEEGDDDDDEEKAKQDAFFAPEPKIKAGPKGQQTSSFQSMQLSRPILRGLASIGFSDPTPIQAKTIPIALLGKDIVGGAVTGSGKTGAFMIPILERLLYRSKKVPTSRVAILMPTRELAVQCFNVAKKLASFTDITFCQLVGGFSLREQESVLKTRPDVIIATPGRFIDHMRNSASFTIDTLEILVLDEADRMLEEGFADELNEILTTIPKSRQTMLFSATMTSKIDQLIRVGLNQPVRLMVDAKKQTVSTLTQEILRLRPGREDKRLAYLLHICSEIFTNRCIIFFRQKKDVHRIRIIFGLFGFKAAELHGNMTQEQRIASVEAFRARTATHLLATDVASRGLDIKGVESVINYEAPQSHEIYLHRVGRTARAGKTGRSCTLAAESDRKVVKVVVKTAKAQGAKIVSRVVDVQTANDWADKIAALEQDVEDILKEEKEEKVLAQAEMQVRKGENILNHEAEIMSRPKRTWFETEKEKKEAKQRGKDELNGAAVKKAGKLSGKDKKKLDARRERKEGAMWKKGKTEREAPGLKAGSRGKQTVKPKKKSKAGKR
jgi:ATP-dependent RNA helicase DDX27